MWFRDSLTDSKVLAIKDHSGKMIENFVDNLTSIIPFGYAFGAAREQERGDEYGTPTQSVTV